MATLFVLSLAKIRYDAKTIISIGFLTALTNLFVRLFTHRIRNAYSNIYFCICIIYQAFYQGTIEQNIFICSHLYCLHSGSRINLFNAFIKMDRVDHEECRANPFLRAAFALPGEIFILLLALVINLYHKKRGNYSA